MKGGIQFTEPLSSNDAKDIHTDTETDGREMGSGAMIHIPSYRNIGSGIQT
jgi:hypothetical protein